MIESRYRDSHLGFVLVLLLAVLSLPSASAARADVELYGGFTFSTWSSEGAPDPDYLMGGAVGGRAPVFGFGKSELIAGIAFAQKGCQDRVEILRGQDEEPGLYDHKWVTRHIDLTLQMSRGVHLTEDMFIIPSLGGYGSFLVYDESRGKTYVDGEFVDNIHSIEDIEDFDMGIVLGVQLAFTREPTRFALGCDLQWGLADLDSTAEVTRKNRSQTFYLAIRF